MTALVASCLIITFSHGGHCLGGEPCTVELGWAAEVDVAPALVAWGLSYAQTAVAEGRVQLAARDAVARIQLDLPSVRARTEFTWSYRLLRQSDGTVLEEGRRTIQVYPAVIPADLGSRLGHARVLVLEREPGLARFLERAGVEHRVAASLTDLELRNPDLVLVGPDGLNEAPGSTATLVSAAERGAAVLVLTQSRAVKVAGLEVVRRSAAATTECRTDHPLLAGLPADSWKSWLPAGAAVAAIVLPPTEPALEIIYWPPVAEGRTPSPLDAVLLEKRTGRGRLVLCQVPASADLDDPRTQTFLVNSLEYLRSAPRPTPPRSERLAATKPAQASEPRPENTVGVGDD